MTKITFSELREILEKSGKIRLYSQGWECDIFVGGEKIGILHLEHMLCKYSDRKLFRWFKKTNIKPEKIGLIIPYFREGRDETPFDHMDLRKKIYKIVLSDPEKFHMKDFDIFFLFTQKEGYFVESILSAVHDPDFQVCPHRVGGPDDFQTISTKVGNFNQNSREFLELMDYLNQEKLIRSYVFDYYLKESKKRPVVSQVLFCVYSLKTDIRVKDIKTEPTRIPQKIRDLLSFKK